MPNMFHFHQIGGELLNESLKARIGGEELNPIKAAIELKIMLYSIHEAAAKFNIPHPTLYKAIRESGQYCRILRVYFVTEKDVEEAFRLSGSKKVPN